MKHRKLRPLPQMPHDVSTPADRSFSLIDSRLNMLETTTTDIMGRLAQARSKQFCPFTTAELNALHDAEPRERVVL